MTKRKTRKPKTVSEKEVLALAAQFQRQFAECNKEARSMGKVDPGGYYHGYLEGRADVFRYCAIAMRQQLLGRAK